jgi:hypothetical protein
MMSPNHRILVKFQHYRSDGESQIEINPNDPDDVCRKVQELVMSPPMLSVHVVKVKETHHIRPF